MKKYDQKFMDVDAAVQVVIGCLRAQPANSWLSIGELRAQTKWPTRNGPGLVEMNTAVNEAAKCGLVEFRDGWDVKANLPARVRLITTPAVPGKENA